VIKILLIQCWLEILSTISKLFFLCGAMKSSMGIRKVFFIWENLASTFVSWEIVTTWWGVLIFNIPMIYEVKVFYYH
jgi:hypothetical protein